MTRGGRWYALIGSEIRAFDGEKEVSVPPVPLAVRGLGTLGENLVASVLPGLTTQQRGPDDPLFRQDVLVIEHSLRRWQVMASEPCDSCSRQQPWHPEVLVERSLVLQARSAGGLWVAREYAYDVARWSSGGREVDRFVVEAGRRYELSEAELDVHREAMRRLWGEEKGNSKSLVVSTRPAVVAMAEGADGLLYLLVRNRKRGEGFLLDRYDDSVQRLERKSIRLPASATYSLAAGRDGLYLAASDARLGVFRLGWERLAAEGWSRVEEVAFRASDDLPPRQTSR